ncbi:arsenate reductase (glutaredoxin) [Candidatus Poribacteria bacterium]|jgi:arsenate reductase (glutaredoxin)|nr:arsenate reductase (glutaredoxin) [Candidatus Poribacteria bacterium]MBT5532925.1 arsenate reductase (glutaredoxin) [Candidatus Poribacteria bacterium]MBT5713172.1 arsenate reductase (glutaredoxin) [Candidatus Poribacteria bacterium]MBT7100649.1 arsenate reductase (glutaredoxin) [Candidatus Poribacteria bacterium]MBT7808586.1 arsenate reductase (glutaredoxin) [Candidatus Poribacteria bacterium]
MAKDWTLYHNPGCSKSRAAMAYLTDEGIDVDVVEYLDAPPTEGDIRNLLGKLGLAVRDIIRDGEDEYDEAGLGDETLSDGALIAAIVKQPILLQRPIIVRGDSAVIGRPTETIDDLR